MSADPHVEVETENHRLSQTPDPLYRRLSAEERKSIYQLLVFSIWSDGKLSAREVRTARLVAEGLQVQELLDAGGVLRRNTSFLTEATIATMSPLSRQVAYATAVWAAVVEERIHRSKARGLRVLRRRLDLDESTANLLELAANLVHAGTTLEPALQYGVLLRTTFDHAGVDAGELEEKDFYTADFELGTDQVDAA
ncbi:MAG: hypothetical protein AAGF12_17130 [Myxococcota bacterium]